MAAQIAQGKSNREIAETLVVAERAPAAHGACRAVGLDGATLHVEADAPIVAQELRLRASELVEALRRAPGAGGLITSLRVTVRVR